ncbi:MAG: PD-(D/E)XK nuclease family protein [Syntrophomonadaceae bacterium]|nr:PD-(D/E)XK nuclease family protein [Syntrophomonadaceae bacterium]
MNDLLTALAGVCKKFPVEEKRLVMPSYQTGHVLSESLSQAGVGWVNLRAETPTGLALQIAGDFLAERHITLLDGYLTSYVVEEILQKLQERGELRFFNKQKVTSGLAAAITTSLMELRECNVTSSSLSPDDFVCSDKGQDIKLILQEYERYLDEHSLLDSSGLLALAVQLAASYNNEDEIIYLMPSFVQWTPLQRKLVSALAGGNLYPLPVDTFQENRSLKGKNTVSFYHAYGMTNELREVLRRLHSKRIPLDQVTVAYTNQEYVSAIYSLSLTYDFEFTVFEGISAFLTGPGRTLQAILSWVNSDFSTRVFSGLLLSGDLVIKPVGAQKEIPPLEAVRLLRDAGLGWGKDRYQLLEHYTQQLGNEQAEQINSVIQSLIKQIPEENDEGHVPFGDFCRALAEMVQSLTKVKDDFDSAALTAITSCLKGIAELSLLEMTVEEAVDSLTDLLKKLKVGRSGPQAGKLHLSSYRNLVWSSRPYTFVVGLDASSFPGSLRQDPVLLDSERKKINADLPLSVDKLEDSLASMANALASRRGELVISYPSFDVVENRELFPAPLLLQIYRQIKADPLLDYSDFLSFLGDPAGYSGGDADHLDEAEWWLSRNKTGELFDQVVVSNCYSNISSGQKALEARQLPEPTEYDGALPVDLAQSLSSKILSCSQLEYLAGCPYAFFLRNVLGVRPPEEILFDPAKWLDPLKRGTLLHSIFCDFMRRIKARGEKPDLERHQILLQDIAKQQISYYKQMIPPPSELVFKREVDELFDCCRIFLSEETRRDTLPLFFEVPFGLGPEEVKKAGYGLSHPISIDLGNGRSLRFSGIIDRIDQIKPGVYCVWDYKTGSARDYGEQLFFNKGRQIQHALYAVAAEEILKKLLPGRSPRVKFAGYLFPSVRGEGKQVVRKVADRQKLVELLNTLLEIMEKGTFVASHEGSQCHYCDYQLVCGQDAAVKRAKVFFENTAVKRLDPWRRLQEYV